MIMHIIVAIVKTIVTDIDIIILGGDALAGMGEISVNCWVADYSPLLNQITIGRHPFALGD